MAFPLIPTWATGGSAAVTPPLSGTQSTGFVNGERPPNQYLNWLFQLIGTAFTYLSGYPRPPLWSWLPAGLGNPQSGPLSPSGTNPTYAEAGVSYSTSTGIVTLAAGAVFSVPITLKVGELVTGVGVTAAYVSGHSPLSLNVALLVISPSTGAISLPSGPGGAFTTASSSLATFTFTIGTPYTAAQGEIYYLLVTNPNSVFSTVGEVTAVGYQSSYNY